MITSAQIQPMMDGGTVVDESGGKIGKIGQVYLDDQSGNPEWVTAKTGMFGGAETFIPLRDGDLDGSQVRVPYTKDKIKDAPKVEESEGHLTQEQEAELYRYYGLTADQGHTAVQGREGDHDTDRGAGHDTSGPDTDEAMTRSEEQVHVGTAKTETGRGRLRKHVVTENVTQTVPVSHEEVRVEREPITDANRGDATSGGDITEEEHEVTLNEERVVVDKETVPVERVRMDKATVTEDQQVSEDVRKEQIDTDVSDDTTDGRGLDRS